MNKWTTNIIKSCALIMNLAVMNSAVSGVVLTGTRVIFADGQKDKTIYFQNKDHYPNLVQIWLDEGNEDSTLENNQSPFAVSPPIFRINPNTGQSVRLLFTGEGKVPADKESLFYMNFSELPAIKKQDSDENRLMVIFKNRVKVFYRPKNLKGSPIDIYKELKFKLEDNIKPHQLIIENPTAYYANVKELNLISEEKNIAIKQNELIAPKQTVNWTVNTDNKIIKNPKIKITLVNDYGVLVDHVISLNL